LVWAIQIHEHF